MENYGRLRARYYIIKTSGIFTKSSRILQVHDNGLLFTSSNSLKDHELIPFKENFEIILMERNDRDFQLKTSKGIYLIACSERTRLLTDIYYYKVIKLKQNRI